VRSSQSRREKRRIGKREGVGELIKLGQVWRDVLDKARGSRHSERMFTLQEPQGMQAPG